MHIGAVIAQLRANHNMTRIQLAERCGIPMRTIGRIENGEHLRCEWLTVRAILVEGFGVHLEVTYAAPTEKMDPQKGFIF
jgi:transcriptional regulator with XRE-family HTH domain